MPPLLEMRGITKRFGDVVANADVSLLVEAGEIHALLGENGAGKSTLVKMMFGLLQPDAGEMLWQGRGLRLAGPAAARALGIGMVFQHFSLFERMTVLENIALGLPARDARSGLAERIRAVSGAYRLPLDPARPVWSLSVGERQRIEIVRCLLQKPRLLIMDEPTSVLTPQEAGLLFATLRQLASEGCAILYISHKLEEIRALCGRATVLRGGRAVGACVPAAESAGRLAAMMIGAAPPALPRRVGRAGAVRLDVRGLDLVAGSLHGTALRGVSFSVRAGEVLGIGGVAGNGQAELFAALSGERRVQPDAVLLDGRAVGGIGPGGRRGLGLCTVPEDRLGHAAVPGFSLSENGLLTGWRRMRLSRLGVLRRGAIGRFAASVVAAFDVRGSGPAAALSGGNLQKFVVGREILQRPEVLVVAQPTWGVDAGAAGSIHAALLGLAAAGSAVVVISQDLDELRAIGDRMAVMAGGVLREVAAGADTAAIGLLMAGVDAG